MKRVLIITYYWPPSGGAGVHRWLKVSKYLAERNQCYIYTPQNPDFALQDESLLQRVSPKIKVLKRRIFEPYFIYKAFLPPAERKKVNVPSALGGKDQSLLKQTATWVRGNVFVPDPRIFWVKPSFRYLKSIIKEEKIDVIITTGPPHSMHLIGWRLKNYFGQQINWIADFRDPWTNIAFYDKLKIGRRAHAKHIALEKKVITACDTLVTVSQQWGKDFEELGAKKVKVIYNGFDPSNFQFPTSPEKEYFYLTHVGSLNEDRNPHALWKAAQALINENEAFRQKLRIQLIGNLHPEVLQSIEQHQLNDNLEAKGYLPFEEALKATYQSTIALLLLNDTKDIDGRIPMKIFEYMGAGNPILAIGKPTGDTGKIINQYQLGKISDFGDVEGAKAALSYFFELYQSKKLKRFSPDALQGFTIQSISRAFESLF